MQTQEHVQAAYDMFVETYAAYANKMPKQVRTEISRQQFDSLIDDLYSRYMSREFTIGKFADLLQVPVLNLYDILAELELPIRST